ncbi:MAG: hypothetical protein ACYTFW_16775 [Planctomycetota bacterium]|jgi:hypothetical protein
MKILEDPPLAVERKLPWLIDTFLYPLSASGMIHLAFFLFGPSLLGLIYKLILSRIFFGTLIALALYIMLVGYALYYLACCVFDSSKGGRRAPDISVQYAPDKADLISQLFLLLGSVAICFWPTAVYQVLTKRIDLIFWLLAICGIFFFPMALLAAVLFDAIHALNPIFIIVSISKTIFKYCGLVLFYCVLGGLVALVMSDLHNLSAPQNLRGAILYVFVIINYFFSAAFIYKAMALVYLAMVGAHLLGSFYWWHKDKLNWGL